MFWPSLLFCAAATAAAKSLQLCLTLCDRIEGSPWGSPVPGILQVRTLEWIAISFSNAWKWKVKVKSLSRVWLLATPWTAAYQAPPSMGFSRQEYWSGVPLPSPFWGAIKCECPWAEEEREAALAASKKQDWDVQAGLRQSQSGMTPPFEDNPWHSRSQGVWTSRFPCPEHSNTECKSWICFPCGRIRSGNTVLPSFTFRCFTVSLEVAL